MYFVRILLYFLFNIVYIICNIVMENENDRICKVGKIISRTCIKYTSYCYYFGSTSTKQAVTKNYIYRTLDDTTLLDVALQDPQGFLEHDSNTLIIDEIQKAPILLPEIKRIVDNNNAKGQFVLTGSSDVRSNPKIKESLAGRVKNVRLRSLTEGEIQGIKPNFIEKAFAKDFPTQIQGCSKKSVLSVALRGGYPEVLPLNKSERKDWYKDYLDALIEHDLRDIASIKNEDALRQIINVLSAWSSKYIDLDGICSSCDVLCLGTLLSTCPPEGFCNEKVVSSVRNQNL